MCRCVATRLGHAAQQHCSGLCKRNMPLECCSMDKPASTHWGAGRSIQACSFCKHVELKARSAPLPALFKKQDPSSPTVQSSGSYINNVRIQKFNGRKYRPSRWLPLSGAQHITQSKLLVAKHYPKHCPTGKVPVGVFKGNR